MTSASIRRGLFLLGVLLVGILAVLDLTGRDSLLRRAWSGLQPTRMTPVQERIEEFRRTQGESLRR